MIRTTTDPTKPRFTMRRSTFGAASVLVALALTACSSSGSDAPPASEPKGVSTPASNSSPGATSSSAAAAAGDGCQYATVGEVSAAVGSTVTAQPAPAAPPFNAPSCLYATGTTPQRQITVAVYTKDQLKAAGGRTAESFMTAVKGALAGVQPISGLGDDAFSTGSAGTSVYVRTGGTVVHVTAGIGGTSDTARTAVRTVTEAVLGRI
jgi:hypothetical protein